MPNPSPDPSAHRQQTDESLREERTSTDATLQERSEEQRRTEADATQGEREQSDARTQTARERTDEQLPESKEKRATRVERAAEDASLQEERVAADTLKDEERTRIEEIVFKLFEKERLETDKHLQAERVGLDDATKLRLRYLAMLGHDLRSMIAGIGLQSSLAVRVAEEEGRAQDLVGAQRILRISKRMERLVNDLVDTSTLDSGTLKIARAEGELGHVALEIAEIMQVEAHAKGVALDCEISEGPLAGQFDYERILQVLGNLVGNALKFTPAGGHVTVRARREGALLVASVADTGPGIAPEKLDVIFEPFQQLGPNRKGSFGLGLHIARSIILAHGGRIWVDSKPGEGSTFSFSLASLPA